MHESRDIRRWRVDARLREKCSVNAINAHCLDPVSNQFECGLIFGAVCKHAFIDSNGQQSKTMYLCLSAYRSMVEYKPLHHKPTMCLCVWVVHFPKTCLPMLNKLRVCGWFICQRLAFPCSISYECVGGAFANDLPSHIQ